VLIYLITSYDFFCKQSIVLPNKPTINCNDSSVRGSNLAHTTDSTTPRGSWPHYRTSNQTRAQLIYSIRV